MFEKDTFNLKWLIYLGIRALKSFTEIPGGYPVFEHHERQTKKPRQHPADRGNESVYDFKPQPSLLHSYQTIHIFFVLH